jgi:hypothetical protein
MKKTFMLLAVGVFTLSSFSNAKNSKNNSTTKLAITQSYTTWYYTCSDGRKGRFLCNNCGRSEATIIANGICQ